MKFQTFTFYAGQHFASYLVNNDATGLDDTEQAKIDDFIAKNKLHNGHFDISDENLFNHCHVTDLYANCCKYTFYFAVDTVLDLLIDAETKGAKKIISRLKRLESTVSVEFNGCYHADNNYCQIAIQTKLSIDALEHYLWLNNFDYIGVVYND